MSWCLSRVGDRCGHCHERIPAASPMCRLLTGRVRCAACAERLIGERPPALLLATIATPPKPPRTNDAHPLQPFVERFRRQLEADFKQRAGGDTDEPYRPPAPPARARR